MDRPLVVVAEADGFPKEALSIMQEVAQVVLLDCDRRELLGAVGNADVLWVRLRHRIDAEVMESAPRLKVIATPTTGLNHIDTAEAEHRGISVLSLAGDSAFLQDVRATAELTVGLLLALIRKIPAASAHVAMGGWDRYPFRGHELYGKTAGVVGYGRLGRIVADYLHGFGMCILASDPYVDPGMVGPNSRLLPLHDLLPRADVVTVHASLTPETRLLFGEKEFALMKRGAWFVNTSRGELVDEDALLFALESGHLKGAALDVLTDEWGRAVSERPLVHYARTHDNLLITPHIGGCTTESMGKTEVHLARKLCAVLSSL